MIHLHYSNRLERLVGPFAELVSEDQAHDPLGRATVVVPGRALQEFLKLRLADREGVAANLDFPFLRGFLARTVEHAARNGFGTPIKVLDVDGLQLAVFEYLREALPVVDEADLDPVRAYLAAEHNDRRQRDLRVFQLSGRVAWLIREYSTARRRILEQWQRGTTLAEEWLRATENWQRLIYISLFASDGSLRPAWIAPPTDNSQPAMRWMMLPFAFDAIADKELRGSLPARLHIFGIGYVGPEFIRIFGRLGALTDLHIYTLNPCREFWEDVPDRRTVRPPRVGALIESAEDPFGLEGDDESLALRYWGRAGREYIRLLNEITDCDFDEHFVEAAQVGHDATLLSRLQQAILKRNREESTETDRDGRAVGDGVKEDDGSIRILECPGVRREIEIAANAIWSLMHGAASDGEAPLRFHQIAVLLPDSLRGRYLAHVESVFTAAHRIPVNLVDRHLAGESRIAEAVVLLLKLPLGRYTRDEMLRLLTHPAIAGSEGEPYAQTWPELCRRMGVHFGADERAFTGTYVEPKLFHWDHALKQLALGTLMTGAPSRETRVFSADGTREYLPFEGAEDSVDGVAIMVRKARALILDALEMAETEIVLSDWRRVLIDLIATYVNPADRADERVRDLMLGAIEAMGTDGLRCGPVPYQVALELALARIEEVAAELGTYAESGVVVGTLATLRSLPFRVIFMLGLGEVDFPAREPRDPLDIRQVRRQAGDVSPAERDRYGFLETLLAARERIYLSYVSRDTQTGEGREPSAVIRDLQFILRGMIGVDAVKCLALVHPVNPHDCRYFADLTPAGELRDERLETFDRRARSTAQIATLRADLELRCGPLPEVERDTSLLENLNTIAHSKIAPKLHLVTPPPVLAIKTEDGRLRISLSALRHYLECPLQGAARHAQGLREEDDRDDTETGDEPLSLSGLDTTMLLRDAHWRARGHHAQMARCYDEEYHLRLLQGGAPVGPFAEAIRKVHLARLETGVRQAAELEIMNLDRWRRVAIGGIEEFIDVDRAIDPIVLSVNIQRPDGRSVTSIELCGAVGPVAKELDKSIKLIARDARTSDFLDGLFAAVVLAAAGEEMPAEFTALVVGGAGDEANLRRFTRTINVPTYAEARAYLSDLVTDLLHSENDYFLPIEAVELVLKIPGDLTKDAVDVQVGKVRAGTNFCKSDWGPVPNPRKYRVPHAEIKHGLISRRFGLLLGMFTRIQKGKHSRADA